VRRRRCAARWLTCAGRNWHEETIKASWTTPLAVKDQYATASICGNNRENKHYAFGPADPIEAIKFRMEQQGLTPRDLEPFIGPSGRVSEVLNRKRPLSLRMVKQLHDGLRIPYESFLAEGS
jgi:antitoxin component HigA of HigAB toxin-antitoxin module